MGDTVDDVCLAAWVEDDLDLIKLRPSCHCVHHELGTHHHHGYVSTRCKYGEDTEHCLRRFFHEHVRDLGEQQEFVGWRNPGTEKVGQMFHKVELVDKVGVSSGDHHAKGREIAATYQAIAAELHKGVEARTAHIHKSNGR